MVENVAGSYYCNLGLSSAKRWTGFLGIVLMELADEVG